MLLEKVSARERVLMAMVRMLDPEAAEGPVADEILESRQSCESSFHEFIRQAWTVIEPHSEFKGGWELGCVAEHLQAVIDGQINRIVFNVPPGFGKSTIGCVLFPAYGWIKKPWLKWIFSSHSESYNYRDGQKTQDVITSQWYQARWGTLYRLREKAKSRLTNDRGGHRVVASLRGQGTGERGDILTGDDLNKIADAYSQSARLGVHRFWSETMAGRGADPIHTARILWQQRVAEDDISGYVLSREIGYEHVCIPHRWEPKRLFFSLAEAKEAAVNYPIIPTKLQRERPELMDPRTEEGQPFWPERYGEDGVRELEKEYQGSGANGQLRQAPESESGGIFQKDWYRHFTLVRDIKGQRAVQLGADDPGTGTVALRVPLAGLHLFQVIDTAMSDSAEANYTAIGTYGVLVEPPATDDAHEADKRRTRRRWLLVLNVWRERLKVTEQWDAIERHRRGAWVWNPETRTFVEDSLLPWPGRINFQAIEPKASGMGLIQHSQAVGSPLRMIEGDEFKGGKIQRAIPLAELYRAGLVYHARGGMWLPAFEGELSTFPRGANDDQVDTATYAGIMFNTDRILAAFASQTPSIMEQGKRRAERAERGVIEIGGHRIRFDDD